VRTIGLLCSTLLLASCDSGKTGTFVGSASFAPTSVTVASPVFAEPVIIISSCPGAPVLTTGVTLVITSGLSNPTLDTVTFRLIDGSSVGGPAITFPRPQLESTFGSTVIVGTRSFGFTPSFPCPVTFARSVLAEGVLVDQANVRTRFSVTARIP
jgi:hypothetical protein